jgi:cell division protein FtsI (penicillin-binding protein 3)/stage V sporulation protein D (sporulation-specific penicillin-binding protein)
MSSFRGRLRLLSAIIICIALLFVVRLYFLQVIHGHEFRAEAEKQYVSTVTNLFDRGNIYLRAKDTKLVTAATINSGYIVSITPKLLVDKEGAYGAINAIVPLSHDAFMEKATKDNDPYEEILKRVSESNSDKLIALHIPGLKTFRETWRYYPGGSLAAQVLGFVGYNDAGTMLVGRYGLESIYNDNLIRGENNLYINFFAELFTNLKETVFDRTKDQEADLVLTIEPTVQDYLEQELQGVMNEWHSSLTGGIIMDPKTGAVYAMAVNPTFDLNEFNKVKDGSVFANPSVQDVYEMGSIVKPLTMAAGIDAGVVTAKTTYNDVGRITMDKKTFSNYDGVGRGPGTSMQEVLNQSLNTGVAFVVGKLGNQRFADYMTNKYHLGEETGIDLPGERQGLMTNLTSKRDIEYATASFGQGIAMTPINMASALAILGNGGVTITPHVVDEIKYTSGKVKKFTPNPPEQVLKKETSEEITRMLVTVVDKALLNGTVKIPEYSIAAKTGTAQIARPRSDGGGYYEDRFMHTFFGYFPAYDPKFIVFLYTYDPKNATFASHTLTMPFIRTAKFLLHYYGVPPDRVANVINAPVEVKNP